MDAPEFDVRVGELVLIGVAWFRVAMAADGTRLVLEGPVNSRPEAGGLW